CWTKERGLTQRSAPRYSNPSSQPNRPGPDWAFQSAAKSRTFTELVSHFHHVLCSMAARSQKSSSQPYPPIPCPADSTFTLSGLRARYGPCLARLARATRERNKSPLRDIHSRYRSVGLWDSDDAIRRQSRLRRTFDIRRGQSDTSDFPRLCTVLPDPVNLAG